MRSGQAKQQQWEIELNSTNFGDFRVLLSVMFARCTNVCDAGGNVMFPLKCQFNVFPREWWWRQSRRRQWAKGVFEVSFNDISPFSQHTSLRLNGATAWGTCLIDRGIYSSIICKQIITLAISPLANSFMLSVMAIILIFVTSLLWNLLPWYPTIWGCWPRSQAVFICQFRGTPPLNALSETPYGRTDRWMHDVWMWSSSPRKAIFTSCIWGSVNRADTTNTGIGSVCQEEGDQTLNNSTQCSAGLSST